MFYGLRGESQNYARQMVVGLDPDLVGTLVHLSVWSQLGVLCREYLTRFFVNGCGGTSWGPCRTF